METTRAQEIYESIMQSLMALKRELEGTGETSRHEAETIDDIVASLRELELQSGPAGA